MGITAQEIRSMEFTSAVRGGYDVDQVDEVLAKAADALEKAQEDANAMSELFDDASKERDAKIEELNQRITELAAENEELRALNESNVVNSEAIGQALIEAQKTGNDIVKRANDKAEQTRLDAEAEAKRIVDTANAERIDINHQVADIVEQRETERSKMIRLLSSMIEDLQVVSETYAVVPAPSNDVMDALGEEKTAKYDWVKIDDAVDAVADEAVDAVPEEGVATSNSGFAFNDFPQSASV